MNPLLTLFLLALFLEDFFFRQGKYIKYYLYIIGFYCVFYYIQHKSTFHSHTKKFNMAAFDQSFDSIVYARVRFDLSNVKDFLKKYSEKTKKDINLSVFWIKVVGDVFMRVPESNEKIRFGLKGLRDGVDISVIVNTKGKDVTYLTIRNVTKKTLDQVHDELYAGMERIRKNQDEDYNKNKKFLRILPTFLLGIVMELEGILSVIGISLPWFGIKKNHYGSVVISLIGKYGLKNVYVPLYPYTQTTGVFVSCAVEKKKYLNLDGTYTTKEYLPVNFTLDHRYIDGVLSAKMVKAARNICEKPETLQVY